jgi:hypothetical protein
MRTSFILLTLLATPVLAQDELRGVADEPAAAPASVPVSTASEPVTEASDPAVAASPDGVKTMSGMSILGNEEAPKSLVIVPWKSSRLGDGLGVTNALDERPRPLDREVFMRELHYFSLRSGGDE